MSATPIVFQRPDVDIAADIDHLIAHYPPLTKDRRAITVQVREGVVTIKGHVQTPSTRRYFLDRLPGIASVERVDDSTLFDDETIRIRVGQVIPAGVRVSRVHYGDVFLTGTLPARGQERTRQSLISQVNKVPGVSAVITQFTD